MAVFEPTPDRTAARTPAQPKTKGNRRWCSFASASARSHARTTNPGPGLFPVERSRPSSAVSAFASDIVTSEASCLEAICFCNASARSYARTARRSAFPQD